MSEIIAIMSPKAMLLSIKVDEKLKINGFSFSCVFCNAEKDSAYNELKDKIYVIHYFPSKIEFKPLQNKN